jgi:hypothetical protein
MRWQRRRFSRLLLDPVTPVSFRALSYYRPSAELTRDSSFAKPILAYADLICAGQFPFLGYGTHELGLFPNWSRDFVSGGEWPVGKLRPAILISGSDPKVPWELSRLQFLPVLAKAYWLTRARRYRDHGEQLLKNWVENNPAGRTINWAIAMEPALRAVSICQFLSLAEADEADKPQWLIRSLWEHLIFIETHLEFSYRFRGNHYLSNLLGLFCLSVSLEGPGMEERQRRYLAALEVEMRNQVYPEGADYEASSGYHILVTQMFTSALLFARAARLEFSEEFLGRLSAMYDFTSALACGSGRVPHIGDCDDGRVELSADDLEQMVRLPVSERHSLQVASHLGIGESISDKRLGGRVDDALWLGAVNQHPAGPYVGGQVRVFPEAGIAVAHNELCTVAFLAQPNGLRGKGSHTHNDKLAIVASVRGIDLLCDSGTGSYTRDLALRNRLRSTAAHNTVKVDEEEQNTLSTGPAWAFCIGNEAAVMPIECFESPASITLCSAHSGYATLGVIHTRRVVLEPYELQIEDDLKAEGEHTYAAYYHLSSEWRVGNVQRDSDHSVTFALEGPSRVNIRLSASSKIKASVEDAPVSRAFGAVVAAQCLVMAARHIGSLKAMACLSWGS